MSGLPARTVSRQIKSLKDVVDWGLCIGCGACAFACRKGHVSLVNIETVGIRPRFSANECATCQECLAYCPGYTVDSHLVAEGSHKQREADHEFGPALEIWEGYATDSEIRFRASSTSKTIS